MSPCLDRCSVPGCADGLLVAGPSCGGCDVFPCWEEEIHPMKSGLFLIQGRGGGQKLTPMTDKVAPPPALHVVPLPLVTEHGRHAVLALEVVRLGRFPVAEGRGAAVGPPPGVLEEADPDLLGHRRCQRGFVGLC